MRSACRRKDRSARYTAVRQAMAAVRRLTLAAVRCTPRRRAQGSPARRDPSLSSCAPTAQDHREGPAPVSTAGSPRWSASARSRAPSPGWGTPAQVAAHPRIRQGQLDQDPVPPPPVRQGDVSFPHGYLVGPGFHPGTPRHAPRLVAGHASPSDPPRLGGIPPSTVPQWGTPIRSFGMGWGSPEISRHPQVARPHGRARVDSRVRSSLPLSASVVERRRSATSDGVSLSGV